VEVPLAVLYHGRAGRFIGYVPDFFSIRSLSLSNTDRVNSADWCEYLRAMCNVL
jgi:hypothetical protein